MRFERSFRGTLAVAGLLVSFGVEQAFGCCACSCAEVGEECFIGCDNGEEAKDPTFCGNCEGEPPNLNCDDDPDCKYREPDTCPPPGGKPDASPPSYPSRSMGGNNGNGESEPVFPFSGEFLHDDPDMSIQGRGFDFHWTRTYRSRLSSHLVNVAPSQIMSRMGNRWDHNHNIHYRIVTKTESKLIVTEGDPVEVTVFIPADPSECNGDIYATRIAEGTYDCTVDDGNPKTPPVTTNHICPEFYSWNEPDITTDLCDQGSVEGPLTTCLVAGCDGDYFCYVDDQCAGCWDCPIEGDWVTYTIPSYDEQVIPNVLQRYMVVYEGSGKKGFFEETELHSNVWVKSYSNRRVVEDSASGGYRYEFEDGTYWLLSSPDTTGRGKVVEGVDRNGNKLTYAYDNPTAEWSQRKLVTITDTLGRPITLSYGTEGFISYIEDFTGRRVNYTHETNTSSAAFGDLISATSPAVSGTVTSNNFPSGKTTSYGYAAGHLLEEVWDGRANDTNHPLSSSYLENVYDTEGRVSAQRWGDGWIDFAYAQPVAAPFDNYGAVKRTIINDREGNVREYYYDNANRAVRTVEYTGKAPNAAAATTASANRPNPATKVRSGDPDYFTTVTEYKDVIGSIAKFIDANGTITEYVYEIDVNPSASLETRANLLEVIRKPGTHTPVGDQSQLSREFTYGGGSGGCGCGTDFPVTETDAEGRVTTNTYDASNNLLTKTHPTVSVLPNGFLSAISSSQTIVETWTYNAFGLPKTYTDPEGNVTAYEYYSEADPDGDGLDPTSGLDTTVGADGGGYLKSVTVDTTRNPATASQSNSGTNPAVTNGTTTYLYDPRGNPTRVIDPRGVATDYAYNALDQVVEIKRAAAVGLATPDPSEPVSLEAFAFIERFHYDAADNLVLQQVEDRGNGSGVVSSLPQADVQSVGLVWSSYFSSNTTPFIETIYKYDILNNRIETLREGGLVAGLVRSKTRYNKNGYPVMVIHPEGNADVIRYDERDLVFQRVSGASSRPAEGVYFSGDPTTFDRPGGSGTTPSTVTYNYDGNRNLVEVVDALHHGGTTSSIAGAGDVSRRVFDSYNRLVKEIDPLGNETRYVYDASGKVIREIAKGAPGDDAAGTTGDKTLSVREYVYDQMDRRVAVHDVLFQTPDVTLARSVTLTDSSSMDAFAKYPADLGLAGQDTAAVPGVSDITVIGRLTSLVEYDRLGRVVYTITDDFDVERTQYDGAGRVIKTTDSALGNGYSAGSFSLGSLSGNTVELAHDDNGNPIEMLETDVSALTTATATYRTTSFYDSLDRLTTISDNLGQTTDYRYDSRGNAVAVADPMGPTGSRTIQRRGLGSTATVNVNTFGNVSQNYFDGLGQLVQSETMLTWSGSGNGTFIGASTSGVRLSIPVGFLDPSQSGDGIIRTSSVYDSNGDIIARRDDNGNITGYIYDNQGRLLTERQGLSVSSASTAFSVSGGDSGTLLSSQGTGGEPVVDTEAAGTDTDYAYDVDGNRTGTTDPLGNVFAFTFDGNGRQKTAAITRASGVLGTTSQTAKYDGRSRRIESFDNNDPATTTDDVLCTWSYDSLSRQVEETRKIGSQTALATSCFYDVSASNSVYGESACIYPDGRQTNARYDGLDRLVARKDQGASTDIGTYAYQGSGGVATLTYQNGVRLTHMSGSPLAATGLDGVRRVTNHRWEKTDGAPGAGTLVMGFEHRDSSGTTMYDRAGNKRIEYRAHDPGNSEMYKYDSAYRLGSGPTSYTAPNARGLERGTFQTGQRISMSTVVWWEDWDLDGVHNWMQSWKNSSTAEARTHSDFNEIATRDSATLVHDANGNLTDDGTLLLEYDALNRLARVKRESDQDTLAEYIYDAGNRRQRKIVSNGGVTENSSLDGTAQFVYHGWRLIEERDGSDALLRQFVYGTWLEDIWVLDDRTNGSSLVQLNDATGSQRLTFLMGSNSRVAGLLDEVGNAVEAYSYSPYGAFTLRSDGNDSDNIVNFTSNDLTSENAASAFENNRLLHGSFFDHETTLFYLQVRYFSPRDGAFCSQDPSGPWYDAHNIGNAMAYAGANPVALMDITGFQTAQTPRIGLPIRVTPPPPTYQLPNGRIISRIPRDFEPIPVIRDPRNPRPRPIPLRPVIRRPAPRNGPLGKPQPKGPYQRPYGPAPKICPQKCPDHVKRALQAKVDAACQGAPVDNWLFNPRLIETCAELDDHIRQAEKCRQARLAMMIECFDGGDQDHTDKVDKITKGIQETLMPMKKNCEEWGRPDAPEE